MTKEELIKELKNIKDNIENLIEKANFLRDEEDIEYEIDLDDMIYSGVPLIEYTEKKYKKAHKMVPIDIDGKILYEKQEYMKPYAYKNGHIIFKDDNIIQYVGNER